MQDESRPAVRRLLRIAALLALGTTSFEAQSSAARSLIRICVADLLADSPAMRAGIAGGDCLLRIDGAPLDPAWTWVSDEVVVEVRSRSLEIERGTESLVLEIGPGDPGWTLRLEGDEGLETARRLLGTAIGSADLEGSELEASVEEVSRLVDGLAASWLIARAAQEALDAGHVATSEALFGVLARGAVPGWALRARYGLGRVASRRGAHDEAAEHFAALRARLPEAASSLAGLDPELVAAWVLEEWSRAERTRGDLDRSLDLAETALRLRRTHAPSTLAEASAIDAVVAVLFRRNEHERAEPMIRRGLELCRQLDPDSLLEADLENGLGLIHWGRGDLAAAAQRFEASLAIARRVRPDSLRLANDWNNLGLAAWNRGQLEDAVSYHEKALALRRRLDPSGLTVAASLTNLGNALFDQGDLGAAERAQSGAVAILERLAPEHLDTGHALNNLGNVAMKRGDWSKARALYLRALAVRERWAPRTVDVALTLNNLGVVAGELGQRDASQEYLERALEIHREIAPESHHVASALLNLGTLAEERHDLELARSYYQGALDIDRARAPDAIAEARARHNLARVENELGDLDGAIEQLEKALAITRRQAPGGLEQAHALHFLAMLRRSQGREKEAGEALTEALAIREQLAPGSLELAYSLNLAGHQAVGRGELAVAERRYSRAIDEVERARRRAGGSAARTGLATRTSFLYHDLALLQARDGRVLDALATLERGRARALREMLAERDLDWRALLPEPLAERRRELDLRRRRLEDRLARSAVDAVRDLEALHGELAVLGSDEDAFEEEVRRQVPAFAEMAHPRPLSGAALEAMVDPGTLALVLSVGARETLVLALRTDARGATAGRAHVLELTEDELAGRVSFLRRWLAAPGPRENLAWSAPLVALRREVVGPLEDWLGTADRVLLMADGPLHRLPPSLLTATQVTYSGRLGPPTFVVPALAFLSGVRQRPRSSAATLAWVGFGDPALGASPAAPGAAEIAADVVRPAELVPLPGTRRELERARRLIGGPSRLYLGAAATEEAVRSLPPSRVLHFASHGLIDHRSPTSSSIVLSTEGGGDGEREHDGFLQAWEVIESLDLDSDLVVLSACNTGLGPLAGSEGLLGLSRAFLLAGSRSLLVSLWPLSDQASSLFMEHFYDALLDGVGKDEALRRAQAAVRATEEFRHPYYWAAFELIGDPSPLTGIERRRFAAAVPLSVAVLVALSVALVLIRGIVSRRSWARTRGAGRPI